MNKKREKVWVCISSNDPDLKAGDTIISNRQKTLEWYPNVEKGMIYVVRGKTEDIEPDNKAWYSCPVCYNDICLGTDTAKKFLEGKPYHWQKIEFYSHSGFVGGVIIDGEGD